MPGFVKIAWYGKHFGEEPPLIGNESQGAACIFFSGCNLHCVYCQNYQISQQNLGKKYSVEALAEIMLQLQKENSVCIDLVTPTIWWPAIKKAIMIAKKKGLTIPIVWNSNAYEPVQMLKELEELVDIYLPDFKYGDNQLAEKYSGIKNYVETAEAAIQEMLRQVGLLETNECGLAGRGLIVRHLVLPANIENSEKVFQIISSINSNVHVSLMFQYFPAWRAKAFREINRPLTSEECSIASDFLSNAGLNNGWTQEQGSSELLIPDFRLENPFEK